MAIVDARDAKFYTGADAGQMPRAGRIPSAKNIPFDSVVEENNKFKSPAVLRAMFNSAGVKPGDSVTTYCHIGQQASVLYFIARYLDYEVASVRWFVSGLEQSPGPAGGKIRRRETR